MQLFMVVLLFLVVCYILIFRKLELYVNNWDITTVTVSKQLSVSTTIEIDYLILIVNMVIQVVYVKIKL